MARLRISIVEYLNTAPLVWGFTDGPLRGHYDLSFTVPSLCAQALRNSEADVAIIPAIEYQRMEGVLALPGMAVAAKGEVRSILVLAKRPIEQARRLALDRSSRSSAALVRLLCAGRWGIQPEFIEMEPEPATMLAQADAALVIGDPALRIAIKAETLAGRQPSGELCCTGDPSEQPVPGVDTLFLYDVAHQWREMTGRPCVLAIWVARREAVTPEVVADFLASKEYGLARIPEIAEGAALKLDLPAPALERYLRENIDFSLDDENRAGLEWYFRLCAEAGLIPRARPLELARVTGAHASR
ncbi:MAG TPA: menaquinone biosynthesis protein [Candidatus Acidoferrales bacterium]|nr:menaquinone biosynthesis protein [Candidatus Acidoferrales bacterium]